MNMVTYISRTEQEILSGESYNISYIRKMVKVSFHYVQIYTLPAQPSTTIETF